MVLLTIDLPKDVNKKVEHFKIEHDLKDKRDAIVMLLRGSVSNLEERKDIEKVFDEVDNLNPLKIDVKKLKKLKNEIYN